MPRLARQLANDRCYHVLTRGNNRAAILLMAYNSCKQKSSVRYLRGKIRTGYQRDTLSDGPTATPP